MVSELKLEKIYAQRGIELITPAAGNRILDRLINQKTPTVVAISADWGRARQVGLGGQLPPMFTDLESAESATAETDSGSSIRELLAGIAESERLAVVTDHVHRLVAAVFDTAAGDVALDETLDDLGLDSMMAMEFRVRINAMFTIDLPVLEILRGVSVNSLAVRVLAELQLPRTDASAVAEPSAADSAADDAVDRLIEQLSEADLRALLAELEGQPSDDEPAR
jgi:acyl carrier protein